MAGLTIPQALDKVVGMQNYSIVFLNTTDSQGLLIPAEATLAISTLRYWLLEYGIDDTAVFPDSTDVDVSTVRKRFEAFISDHNAIIYAISCWSSSYTTALMYTEVIRDKRPDTVIVGGGAHFNSRDSIYKALRVDGFDIVFQGGAEPFFEFCKNVFIDKTLELSKGPSVTLKGDVPKAGLFFISDGELKTSRCGVLKKAVVPVSQIHDGYAEITALFSDTCGNNCDYCSVQKGNFGKKSRAETEELITEALQRLSRVWNGPILLSIRDSNPFFAQTRGLTFESIKRLATLDNRLYFSVLADPADLDSEFIEFAKQCRLKILFVGRDRIVEDEFIGRRLQGHLRSQQQLDTERRNLAAFIRAMKGMHCDVLIGYIASPYDTAEYAVMLVEEIRDYIGDVHSARVVPDIYLLNPYNGTAVFNKAGANAWDISEFSYPYPNVWNDKNTEMVWLELLRLTVAPVLSAGGAQMGLFLLEFSAHCAFGSSFPTTSAVPTELRSMAESFTKTVSTMRLGDEATLEGWQNHLRELYLWGLMMSTAAQNPHLIVDYGIEWLKSYVKANDIFSDHFERDLKLIASKQLEGTWYERWAELTV